MQIEFKHIGGGIVYPVGENIIKNMPVIYEMAMTIKESYPHKNLVLWCRGSSGAIIAAIIASQLLHSHQRIVINHVKKDKEDAHNTCLVPPMSTDINIIVDDLMSSGTTISEIYKAYVKKVLFGKPLDCLCLGERIDMIALEFQPKLIIGKKVTVHGPLLDSDGFFDYDPVTNKYCVADTSKMLMSSDIDK